MISQPRNTPSFFIIGAHKAATTFLHRGLTDHTDVYVPENEISYFEDLITIKSPLKNF